MIRTTARTKDIDWYVASINEEFAALRLPPVNGEQRECLCDPERVDEALAMLDDWEARVGLSSYMREELAAYLVDSYHTFNR
jgi:hypothetical protein